MSFVRSGKTVTRARTNTNNTNDTTTNATTATTTSSTASSSSTSSSTSMPSNAAPIPIPIPIPIPVAASAPLAGTRPYINQLTLTSTGLYQLDQLVGGGLPLGSLLLIHEDMGTCHYRHLLHYFLSEGVGHGQYTCALQPDGIRNTFASRLPRNLTLDTERSRQQAEQDDAEEDNSISTSTSSDLNIAWRYGAYLQQTRTATSNLGREGKPQQKTGSSRGASPCFSYDLSRTIQSELYTSNPISILSYPIIGDICSRYATLYQQLITSLQQHQCLRAQDGGPATAQGSRVGRIAIESLLSPIWGNAENKDEGPALMHFLHALRGVVRSTNTVVCITIPSHLYSQTHPISSLIRRIEHMCDIIFSLRSFVGVTLESGIPTTPSTAFGDHDGILTLRKLHSMHTMVAFKPEANTYLFKLSRRKLLLEKLSLPPEMSRDEAHQGAHAPQPTTVPSTTSDDSDIDPDADAREAVTRTRVPDQQLHGSREVHAHVHSSGCGTTGHTSSKLDF